MKPIYFDYAATTPVDERVAEVMVRYLTCEGDYGNPASRSHMLGWLAEEAVENARNELADLIGADSREIVWTSGATESDNLALKGVAESFAPADCHLVVAATEHKAVLDPALHLQQQGYGLTIVQPNAEGEITAEAVAEALQPNTRLVSIMAVNNETGVMNPVEAIGALCAERGIWFHTDAAQAVGKIPVDVARWQCTLLSISAHKFYGPKGMGALYVKRRSNLKLQAQMHGGGHERGMRSGTLATHQIVGMGEAARIASQELTEEAARIKTLRDALWTGIEGLGDLRINGGGAERVPGLLNIAFGGIDGEALMMALRNLAVSTGSACTSATVEPSFVLKAMGLSDQAAHGSLRFSLGRYTTQHEVDQAITSIRDAVGALRKQDAAAS
ncbi:MAG: IscS subfamily cysteine desulfurase [Saccharospirillum sp.]